jgi:hypothetical protein
VADLVSDGFIRVSWVVSISNINAPTVAELNAGTALQGYLTPDGLGVSADTAGVDNSKLSSTFTTMQAGRRSYDLSLTWILQSPRVLEAVLVYQATGNLVVRREVLATTAWTIAQRVEVYPSQCGQPSPVYGVNEMQRRDLSLFCTADPAVDATVA